MEKVSLHVAGLSRVEVGSMSSLRRNKVWSICLILRGRLTHHVVQKWELATDDRASRYTLTWLEQLEDEHCMYTVHT